MRVRTLARPAARLFRRVTAKLTGAAVVLLYHRVYDPELDPLLLSVSLRNFDRQMAYLHRHHAVLSLAELRDGLTRGRLPSGAIGVTFDDGYADNLTNGRPLLEQHGVPATVFVTSGYVESGREFWWDELERVLFFAPKVPGRLVVTAGGARREWLMGSTSRMTVDERLTDRTWHIGRADSPTRLHDAYREIHALLSPMPAAEREANLADLRAQTGDSGGSRAEYLAMTRDQVRALAAGGLVDVGAHTVSHPVLSSLPEREAAHEITQSKRDVEAMLGRPVSTFAYPYGYRGAFTSGNMAAARSAGLSDAYSNFGGTVRAGADRYQLNRFLVRNWDVDDFARQIRRAFGA